jgi:tetratricopeptide (TPR) repeat protein
MSGTRQRKLPARSFAAASFLLLSAVFPPAFAGDLPDQAYTKLGEGHTALLRNQFGEADRLLSTAIAVSGLTPDARAAALGQRALARMREGALRTAIHDFNAAVQLTPEDATLYNNRGTVLLSLGLYGEAAKDFDQAIALAPDYGAAYNNRGNALVLLSDYTEAIADFGTAIALMPGSAVPFNGRGRAHLALGRPAGALRDFSRATELNKRYGQAFANRAEALIALHRYEEAANDYGAAIALGTTHADIYRRRAALYAALKMPTLALADLDEARKLDPSMVNDPLPLAGMPSSEEAVPVASPALALVPNVPCDGQHRPSAENAAGFSKVAETSPHPSVTKLLYAAESPQVDARPATAASSFRTATCGPKDASLAEPLAQIASAEEADRDALSPADWSIISTQAGAHIAVHPDHPDIRLRLEVYGTGEPRLLHWQELDDPLRGIGLLHYDAGRDRDGARLEYVAIIDLNHGKLLSIEPASWGERRASWTWGETELAVVDPDGVPSRISLDGRPVPVIKLNDRPSVAKRAKLPSHPHGQIAKRARAPSSTAQYRAPRWTPDYAGAVEQRRPRRWAQSYESAAEQRLPRRFRQRGFDPTAFAYRSYR